VSVYSIPALLAFGINVSLAVIFFLDDPRSRTHRLFALLVSCFAAWNVADIIVVNSTSPENASVGGAIIVAALLFASSFFLLLSFSFPVSIGSRFDLWPWRSLFLLPPLIFTALAAFRTFSPLDLHKFTHLGVYSYTASEWVGVLNIAMFAVVFAFLGWGIFNFMTQFRRSASTTERSQILYILLGTTTFALLLVALEVFYNREQLHFYASRILSLLISLFFTYAVLGRRFIALRRIGKQGLTYTLVTGVVFAFYLIVIKYISDAIGTEWNIQSLLVDAGIILALALSFRPLVVRVQSLIESLFRRTIFRYRDDFVRFSRDSLQLTSLRDLTAAVHQFLKISLSASSAELLVAADNPEEFYSPLSMQRTGPIDTNLLRIVTAEQKAHAAAELLEMLPGPPDERFERLRGGYVVPLLTRRGINGLLLVGPVSTGRPFTIDEEEFLNLFANAVSTAVERDLLIEKMHTEEIRVANMEKLAALGRLTSGIAHEFRNPLNVISTSAQTILRNPEDVALHQETGRYILEETERLNQTVVEFLQFAKPHTPLWEKGSIADVVDRVMQNLRTRAADMHVEISASIDPAVPEITTSTTHIERVLMNLGQNAIEAMQDGGHLTFSVRPKDRSAILISVSDTGPGIPTEHQARLFDPFFTTKPSGTGLGLPIVYMSMQTLRGKIAFTTDTTGTTFDIELPMDGSRP
jgi:signal transduction histidine kinase